MLSRRHLVFRQSEEDIVTSAIHVEFHERNLALFTRRSVKLSVIEEKIYKFEIATPSIVSYEVEEDGYFQGLATRTEPGMP